jgi:hypothetical protein
MADRLPLFKLRFETPDEARVGTKRAAYAGLASSALTVALVVWSLTDSGAGLDGLVDAWSLIDVAVLLGLSYGTYRGSRVAAVGLLGFFLLSQIISRVQSGHVGGIWTLVIFSALFAQGVAGAVALHRLQEEPDLADQLAALEAGRPAGPPE